MRILLAHSFYRNPGGEDRYVRQQAELLSGSHSVELIAESNEQLSETITTAARMLYSRQMRRDVSRIIARFRPDIVHLHNAYPAFGPAVHFAARDAGVPLVMTVHNYRMRCPNGLMFTEGSNCQRCERGNYTQAIRHKCFPSMKQSMAYAGALWPHRFVGRLEDKVSLFVAPSNFVGRELIRWGIAPRRVTTIPHPVDPQPNANARLGGYGVFVGRLSTEKGVEVLLDALRYANDPPFKVVGGGTLAAALRERASDLGLNNTEFLGAVPADRVGDVLKASRYLVMPSVWNETGGLAALEAMSFGRPLLVTSLGGLPELVRQGTGLVCRPGDARDMAKNIQKLKQDDAFCLEAGTRGLRVSRQEFSPEKHVARLEAAYGTCLEQGVTGSQ